MTADTPDPARCRTSPPEPAHPMGTVNGQSDAGRQW
ncbi:MAG: hypothetical protein QOI01_3335, partial [Mycobacterium sp.]|nr:hypothetical protein [Mycobacterium sp.]